MVFNLYYIRDIRVGFLHKVEQKIHNPNDQGNLLRAIVNWLGEV